MSGSKTPQAMSTGLARVMERAHKEPQARMRSLAHHIDEEALRRAFCRIRKGAAVGVDGVTKEAYQEDLEENLKGLHSRLREQRYRHQPIRRVHIPKEKGRTRPVGVSTVEDKIVQGVLCEVLEAIYEPVFLECSYGFRPQRSAHDALKALNREVRRGKANWVVEFDIRSFFDSIDRPKLEEMLRQRIADKSFRRLVNKCIKVGVLDGEEFQKPKSGTTQGSSLSPVLGNIYLHHVLDLWFEKDVKPRLYGKSAFVRYADDGVFVFEREEDARRVMKVLGKRVNRFGLDLAEDKTRLLDFRKPPKGQGKGKGQGTFAFLGFTHCWKRSRKGSWYMAWKTRSKSLRRAIQNLGQWCRRYRHLTVPEQHAALTRRIQGHFNYFGVNGNIRSLDMLVAEAMRLWHKWLNRRSQRSRLNWQRFNDLLKDYPLPRPRICVNLWATP